MQNSFSLLKIKGGGRRLIQGLLATSLLLALALVSSHGRDAIATYVENGDILALEARYSPEQIMEANKAALLGGSPRTYQQGVLEYLPYLLLEVKYPMGERGETRESSLLWGMHDGEILLDTESWEVSHGYGDAIQAGAGRSDYRLLHALSRRGGYATMDQLVQTLQIDEETLEEWVATAKKKQLVVQKGNHGVQLHFEQPKLVALPRSAIAQQLVTRPYSHGQLLAPKIGQKQIELAARAVFGSDLAIRSSQPIYLPVCRIEVLNPDGSLLTSYWNGVNGRRINYPFH